MPYRETPPCQTEAGCSFLDYHIAEETKLSKIGDVNEALQPEVQKRMRATRIAECLSNNDALVGRDPGTMYVTGEKVSACILIADIQFTVLDSIANNPLKTEE